MAAQELHVVTGAFGYSGRYIAQRLLAEGHSVITFTNSLHRRNPFGERVRAVPFNFDDPEKLKRVLVPVATAMNAPANRGAGDSAMQASGNSSSATLAQIPLGELAEMAYQWEGPFVVDDRRFRERFQPSVTSLDAGAAATVAWAREHYSRATTK